MKPGDIIQVEYNDNTGRLGHSMIVTGRNGDGYRNLLVSYHSSDKPGRLDKPLGQFMDVSPNVLGYYAWRLK